MDNNNNMLALEERIVTVLKTVYDPEIPVDVYNLGLIYDVDCGTDGNIVITVRWQTSFSKIYNRKYRLSTV